MYIRPINWLDTDNSVKSGRVNYIRPINWLDTGNSLKRVKLQQTSPLNEIMNEDQKIINYHLSVPLINLPLPISLCSVFLKEVF